MSDIVILDELPIILTKDHDFAHELSKRPFDAGAIVVLPDDAVLIAKPVVEKAIDD